VRIHSIFLGFQLEVGARVAEHAKNEWEETNKFDWKTFKDDDIRRQFSMLSVLGTAALPAEKLDQVRKVLSICYQITVFARLVERRNLGSRYKTWKNKN